MSMGYRYTHLPGAAPSRRRATSDVYMIARACESGTERQADVGARVRRDGARQAD